MSEPVKPVGVPAWLWVSLFAAAVCVPLWFVAFRKPDSRPVVAPHQPPAPVAPAPVVTPTAVTNPAPPAPVTPPAPVAVAGKDGVIVGGLRVDILSVSLWREQDGDSLRVIWLASTADATRNHKAPLWGAGSAWLGDRFRNEYHHQSVSLPVIRTGLDRRTSEALRELQAAGVAAQRAEEGPGQVTSKLSRYSDLHFDVPVPAADRVNLILGGAVAGVGADFRFVVPRTAWAKD